MRFSDLARDRDTRVVVWGYGREGASVTDHLRDLGVPVSVAEPDVTAGEPVRDGVEFTYGAAGRAALLAADVVVKSPGVPVTHELYVAMRTAGITVTGLTDLWVGDNAARTVAITGSKGKSTTAALLHHLLRHAGIHADLRGNIGTPVLVETDPPADVVVMELSSYQAQSLTVSPRLVAVTSLFPEHLTWHGGVEEYYADKLNAVAQGPETVVVPADAPDVERRVRSHASTSTHVISTDEDPGGVLVDATGDLVWSSGTRVRAGDLPLPGRHHGSNIAVAVRLAQLLGLTPQQCATGLATFAPLPHRMEPVPSTDGRRWIDDSLATAPEAVIASLSALTGEQVAVILGGADRGLDLTLLRDHLTSHPEITALCVGPAGARLARETDGAATDLLVFHSFAAACEWARSEANPARVVLLSPGAPSQDEFTDYRARSAAFRTAATTPEG